MPFLHAVVKLFSVTTALIALWIGLLLLIIFHFNPSYIHNLPFSKYAITYMGALYLLLSGLGAFLYSQNIFSLLSRIIGAILIIFPSFQLLTCLFGIRIDHLFLSSYFETPHVLSIISFISIGFILLFLQIKKYSLLQLELFILFAFLLILIGSSSLLIALFPINLSPFWVFIIANNFYVAVGTILTSISLILTVIGSLTFSKIIQVRVLPFLAFFSFILCVLLFTTSLALDKDNALVKGIKEKSLRFTYFINKEIQETLKILNHSKLEFERAKKVDSNVLKENLKLEHNYISSMGWINSNFELEIIIPQEEKDSKIKLISSKELKNALETFENQSFSHFEGSDNVFLFTPIIWDNKFHGFLFKELNLKKFFTYNFSKELAEYFSMDLYHENEFLFGLNAHNKYSSVSSESFFEILNLHFSFYTYPTTYLISYRYNDLIINITLIGGFFTALLLGLLIFALQNYQKKILSFEQAQKQYKEAKDSKLLALQSAQLGTWEYNPKTQIFSFDKLMLSIFNLSNDKAFLQIEDIINKVHQSDKEHFFHTIKRSIEIGLPLDLVFRIIRSTGATSTIFFKGDPLKDESGNISSIVGIASDISQIELIQNLLTASQGITEALSDSANLNEAIHKILNILHNYLGWSIIALWQWNEETESLQCIEFNHLRSVKCDNFKQATFSLEPKKTSSIPKKIWSSYRPIWINDITKETDFLRKQAAIEDGIHGLLAFPIFEGQKLTGVLELFREAPLVEELDDRVLNLMTSIGIEIGQFIQRNKAEEAKSQLAAIVTFSINGIYSVDLNGYIKSWNAGCEKIFGWISKEMLGKHISEIYPGEKIYEYDYLRDKILAGLSVESFNTQRRKKDGSIVNLSMTISPIRDHLNKVIGACAIARDITYEREIIESLQKSEEKFRTFVETSHDWVWEIDENGFITYSNPSVRKILEFSPENVLGKPISIFVHSSQRKTFEELINENKEKKYGFHNIFLFVDQAGEDHWLESNAEPIFDKEQKVVGYRGTGHDITEVKRIEKLKNELTSVVCHELKTPLTSIHGSLGLLFAKQLDLNEQKELVTIAYRNSERLTRIINDLLDIDKISSGKLQVNLIPILIHDVIKESIKAYQPIADKLNVQLIEEADSKSIKVKADFGRLLQVMMNLLSNALKFSPTNGKVFIKSEVIENKVRVSVKDEGPGIPVEFQSKIFERFIQADSSSKRSAQGVGLGLHISKKLIESHNGFISFTSQEGKGSTFYFELPLDKSENGKL